MLPILNIGPLAIPTAPFVYIIGAWIALSAVERAAKRLRLNAQATYNAAAISLAAGFIGARLAFVALHWSAYKTNLIGIVWPLTSGYELWGGLIMAMAAAIFYARARALPPLPTLDAIAPGLITGLIFVSLADFLAGPGYGIETSVPWAIDLFGIKRHPVQIYEIVFGAGALLSWWILVDKKPYPGELFLSTVIVYSAGRLFVDAYRANAWLTASGIHVLQIISLLILLAALFVLGRQYRLKQAS